MSRLAIFAAILVVIVAACAKKAPEATYVADPVTSEPVSTGKY